MRTKIRPILIPTLLIFTLILLAGCPPVTVVPQPAPEPTEVPAPTVEPTAPAVPPAMEDDWLQAIRDECDELAQRGAAREEELPPGFEVPPFLGLIYVADQLIVVGDDDAKEEVLQYMEFPLEEEISRLPLGDTGQSLLLYQARAEVRVERQVCEIDRIAQELQAQVFADPNYFTSPGGWHGGGSPWTQNGGWSEGTPGGGLGVADPQAFLDQWALAEEGIQLFAGPNRQRVTDLTGDGVSVAIFDSSPFSEDDEGTSWQNGRCRDCYDFLTMGDGWLKTAAADPQPLSVWHYDPIDADTCPGQNRITGDDLEASQDISSHGLFVAGLVQAVAPQSDITLIRVLNKDGCGDLYTIASAILDYLVEIDASQNSVINLSLGVHRPENPNEFGLPEEVATLQAVVNHAVEKGALVVAAAGNDSFDQASALEAEIPALQAGVVGVAATAMAVTNPESPLLASRRSCFSNSGDIAAPGGDGFNPQDLPAGLQEAFEVQVEQGNICLVPGNIGTDDEPLYYCDQMDAGKCLVSLARDPNTREYRYVYWAGTSFATPLVSGLAALLRPGAGSPEQVKTTLNTSAAPVAGPDPAALGAGMISVANATAP